MPTLATAGQLLKFALANVDLVDTLGDAAYALQQVSTYDERWQIVKPVGDKLAPRVDQLLVILSERGPISEAEIEADIFDRLAVLPRGAALPRRDRPWLNAGLQLLQALLPILLANMGS